MEKCIIKSVHGREILDSRGNPTVEAEVTLMCGVSASGAAPSGASTGRFEALELRDGDKTRYYGKGAKKAVNNVNTKISEKIVGMDASDIYKIDKSMLELDGTKEKSFLGANAILAVSIACAKAAAKAYDMPLYRFLGGVDGRQFPIPMMNILNGGAHATNTIDVQEFMIMPVGVEKFNEMLQRCAEVYQALKKLLKEKGYSTSVGDEGGFAPNLTDEEESIQYIIRAIELAGFKAGRDFVIAMDAAASEWEGTIKGEYILPKSKRKYSSEELIEHWRQLVKKYPIVSLEDPLDEEDWDGWKQLTEVLGNKIQLVGDDLFVTNRERLKKGIEMKCGNCILIKPNQIGSISETLDTIKMAQQAGFNTIISHRSGETEDTTIADLAVAVNAGQIKTGAPCRSERVAKYNQLLRIEEMLE